DEVAVNAFLARRIRFTQIPELIERVLDASAVVPLRALEDVRACDREARAYAEQLLGQLPRRRRRLR
ncbi:MAG: 1-deoxy-D-xylulose-5-phosphate reductoisomerase, partial [Acidobacteria bacterium]|nr:1-deoxy-D-xylulose-5-phosphate reductoisomerase [Acidobacteriota bacterium]